MAYWKFQVFITFPPISLFVQHSWMPVVSAAFHPKGLYVCILLFHFRFPTFSIDELKIIIATKIPLTKCLKIFIVSHLSSDCRIFRLFGDIFKRGAKKLIILCYFIYTIEKLNHWNALVWGEWIFEMTRTQQSRASERLKIYELKKSYLNIDLIRNRRSEKAVKQKRTMDSCANNVRVGERWNVQLRSNITCGRLPNTLHISILFQFQERNEKKLKRMKLKI